MIVLSAIVDSFTFAKKNKSLNILRQSIVFQLCNRNKKSTLFRDEFKGIIIYICGNELKT